MLTKVADASAIAAILFGEPGAEVVAERLDGCELISSPLLEFELSNVCLTKLRRHPSQREELLAGLRRRARMDIGVKSVDCEAALLLAEQSRLSLYDASYLWLALEFDAGLVTLDRQLAEAAEKFK